MGTHQGKKVPSKSRLDRLVTFCFDRFDLCCGMLDLFQPDTKEYRDTARRATIWRKRADSFDKLRNWVQA